MKKFICFLALVIAVVLWLGRPFNFKKELTIKPADLETVTKEMTVESVSCIEEDYAFFENRLAQISAGRYNVRFVFKEESGWEESLILTFFDRSDGARLWQVEHEFPKVGEDGIARPCRTLMASGEVPTPEVKCLTIRTDEGAVALPI